jgi:PAS domain S-box-containing protein
VRGKTGKDAKRLRGELAELQRRKAELESSEDLYRRLVEELRHGEGLFRSMADTANDAILVLDEQGTVIYINRAGEDLFEQSAEEIMGRRLHETLLPERFREYSSRAFAARGATGIDGMMGTVREFQAMKKTGVEFPLEVSISTARSGEQSYYITFCRDITDRKRVEEELRESQQRYRDLIENLNDVVFNLDPLGRFSYISPTIARISHYTAEEIISQPFTHFVHPDDVQELLARFERTLSGDIEPYESRVVDKDGKIIHIRTSSRPLFKNGDLVGITGSLTDISKRKRAEEELERYRIDLEKLVEERTKELEATTEKLRRSERHYRSLIRGAVDMIIILNEDFTLRWGSLSSSRITGYTPEDIYGKNILDFLHPDDIQAGREALERILSNPSEQQNIMVRFRHKDGSWHYHEAVENNLLDDPAVKGIVLNSRDITDRVALDNELLRSEKYFRALIENAYDIIAVLNRDGTMGYLSPSLEKLSGFTLEERLGKDAFQFFHPDDLPVVMEAFTRGLEQPGGKDRVEYRWQHKDGSWRWQEAVATNLIGDPVVQGIVVNARDITERKLAEKTLRDSEEMYRTLMLIAPDAVSIADLEGNFVYVSPKTVQLHGYENADEMLGMSSLDLIAPEDHAKAVSSLAAVLEDGYIRNMEGTFLRKDGSSFIGELNAALIRDADGSPRNIVAYTKDITERKLTEQALRDGEERYRSVVETSPDCIIVVDLEGTILMVNHSGLNLFRCQDEAEMVGRKVFEFMEPEELPRALEPMREQVNVLEKPIEFTSIRLDGSRFISESNSRLLRNAAGEPIGFIAVTRDVTERRHAEEALRESEERYRSLVETSPDCIILADLQGKVLMVNPSGTALYGYEGEKRMLEKNLIDFFAPEERQRVKEIMYDKNKAGQQVTIGEYIMLRKDGTRFYGDVTASMVRDMGGKPVGFLGISRDISDRKRAEERLQKLNECFLSLGPDPLENIRLLALTGRDILEADMVRYGRMEKGEFYTFSSMHPDKGFALMQGAENHICYHLLSSGTLELTVTEDIEDGVFRKDPDVRQHDLRSCLIQPILVQGELVGCFNIFSTESRTFSPVEMDVMTMLGKAISIEEERYAFEESLRDFVDIASHELRHPVALLSGFTETLELHGSDMDEATRKEVIEAIKQSAERISGMVMGLINISLVERERFFISKSPEDLLALVERVLREMRIKVQGWEFELRSDGDIMECEVDPERLHDLMVILLDNAVKYSYRGTVVEVVLESSEKEITVSVLDRGIGVPPEHREKLFERFYQVEEAQYHSTPGLGLGLFLARQIVEGHGGRIWFEPREGGGSAFRFTLPAS